MIKSINVKIRIKFTGEGLIW